MALELLGALGAGVHRRADRMPRAHARHAPRARVHVHALARQDVGLLCAAAASRGRGRPHARQCALRVQRGRQAAAEQPQCRAVHRQFAQGALLRSAARVRGVAPTGG